MRQQQGFTLLEIMIAIAISALIAVISIKGWRYYQQKIHLIVVTQKVAAFIACHQMQAAYLNQERQLIYSTYFKMHPPTQQKTRIVSPFLGLPVHLEVY